MQEKLHQEFQGLLQKLVPSTSAKEIEDLRQEALQQEDLQQNIEDLRQELGHVTQDNVVQVFPYPGSHKEDFSAPQVMAHMIGLGRDH